MCFFVYFFVAIGFVALRKALCFTPWTFVIIYWIWINNADICDARQYLSFSTTA